MHGIKTMRRGVTLIELMVVMAVVIILAATSFAYGGTYLSRRQVEGVSFQLVQDLRDVQSTAVFSRRYVKVSFFPTANCYTFERSAGGVVVRRDLTSAAGFVSFITGSTTPGDSVFLTSAEQSPLKTQVDLYFTPGGSASTSGTSVALVDGEGRISLTSRSGVIVDVFISSVIGRIRMAWR
ncbi:MAG: prepilin-type N-terminal cleavage/methylation domain-containing protein [Caldisericia bacterium]